MKSVLAFLGLTGAAALAHGMVLLPQSGDSFFCTDNVSGYSYSLKIEDIGDEDAIMAVYGPKQSLLRVEPGVKLEFTDSDMRFEVYRGGDLIETITFVNFDTNSAFYEDGGDSRPIQCESR